MHCLNDANVNPRLASAAAEGLNEHSELVDRQGMFYSY